MSIALEISQPNMSLPPQQHPRGHTLGTEETISSGSYIVLTPINLLNPSSDNARKAKFDYRVEEQKFLAGDGKEVPSPRWDDTKENKAIVGDYFGFCMNQVSQSVDFVEIFQVIEKRAIGSRPEHWTIQEHSDRSVLILSRYKGYTSVTDLMVALGSRPSRTEGSNCLRGTVRRKVLHDLKFSLE